MTPKPTDASIRSLEVPGSAANVVVGHVRPGLDLFEA